MFDRIKKLLRKKPTVLCIHGFGRRKSTEFNNFKLWGEKSFDFYTFDIFDDEDITDCDPKIWIQRCEAEMEHLLKQNRDIHIIGFSMGGVLATHLASKYDVKKLFLIAPAFEFLSVRMIASNIVKLFSSKSASALSLSNEHTTCFTQVIDLCKNDINLITCPTLFVHGDADEVIPTRSSINAFNKIQHDQKRLILLHDGKHRLMLNENTNNEVYQLFKLFMEDELVTRFQIQADDPIGKKEADIV